VVKQEPPPSPPRQALAAASQPEPPTQSRALAKVEPASPTPSTCSSVPERPKSALGVQPVASAASSKRERELRAEVERLGKRMKLVEQVEEVLGKGFLSDAVNTLNQGKTSKGGEKQKAARKPRANASPREVELEAEVERLRQVVEVSEQGALELGGSLEEVLQSFQAGTGTSGAAKTEQRPKKKART